MRNSIRRHVTYCDYTASGRFLQVIEDYLQTHVYPFYGNTHTGDSYVGLHTTHMVHQARKYVTRGKHLHCRFVTILFNDLFGIQARGGCACAGPYVQGLLGIDPSTSKLILSTIKKGYKSVKPGFTRVSFSYYSSPEETDRVRLGCDRFCGKIRPSLPFRLQVRLEDR